MDPIPDRLVLFLIASLVLIVAPGPDNLLVLTRGVTLGRRAALVSAAGAATGLLGHSGFAAAGLSALLAESATAYTAVRYVGAAYLLYLGIQAVRGRHRLALGAGNQPIRLRAVYAQAVGLNILNPKIAVFFLAYLPQFADPSAGSFALQLLGLGLTFALLTWAVFSVLAYFSGRVGAWPEGAIRAARVAVRAIPDRRAAVAARAGGLHGARAGVRFAPRPRPRGRRHDRAHRRSD